MAADAHDETGLEIEPIGVASSGAGGRDVARMAAMLRTDSPLEGTVAGQIDLMAYPFFSLSKTPLDRSIRFVEGAVSVEIRPSEKGVATIYDKEILIYLASLAIERLDRGERFDGVLTFTAYDFFKLAGLTGASGKNYQRLANSLDRLQGTQVRTTIETGGESIDGWFSWVSEAHVIFSRDAKGSKRARGFRVRITDWLVRAIAADGSVLSYDRRYFKLSALERRIYEIARAGCASGHPVTMGLETLRQRVGMTSPLKKFRQMLTQIATDDALPGYRVFFEPTGRRVALNKIDVTLAPSSCDRPALAAT